MVDPQVGDRIIAEARGNPLALLEAVEGDIETRASQGALQVPGALPMQSRLEATFVRRLEMLPAHRRSLLLVAAAEPVGDVMLLSRATENLGIAVEATSAVEIAVFLEVGSRVRFGRRRRGQPPIGWPLRPSDAQRMERWRRRRIRTWTRTVVPGTAPRLSQGSTTPWLTSWNVLRVVHRRAGA